MPGAPEPKPLYSLPPLCLVSDAERIGEESFLYVLEAAAAG